MRHFADRGGFAHTIHTNYQNDMRFVPGRQFVIYITGVIRRSYQYIPDLFPEYPVQFRGIKVFVFLQPFFNTVNDLYRSFNTYIGAYQSIFQVIQHFFIHLVLACNGLCYFA